MAVYLSAFTDGVVVPKVAEPFTFPGGEVHLKNIVAEGAFDGLGPVTYVADVRGADLDQLMAAALLADVAHDREAYFVLMLPYLPAARADRGEPGGKYVYSRFVNTMGADQVITIDQHSDLGSNWYDNLTDLSSLPLIDRVLESQGHWQYDGIIAPDKGAHDRAAAVATHYGLDLYVADKKRDFETGKILSYSLKGLPKSGKYLVVDDICDGGWTFTELARVSEIDKANLSLWVTHGIFSGKANELRNHYAQILTTDSHPGHLRLDVATGYTHTFDYMRKSIK